MQSVQRMQEYLTYSLRSPFADLRFGSLGGGLPRCGKTSGCDWKQTARETGARAIALHEVFCNRCRQLLAIDYDVDVVRARRALQAAAPPATCPRERARGSFQDVLKSANPSAPDSSWPFARARHRDASMQISAGHPRVQLSSGTGLFPRTFSIRAIASSVSLGAISTAAIFS